ncbi:hypothetical protein HanPI659440_Chr02g0084001 [Helianthus annuus]|nr:hypothetical protein HanPI659440_Chr02g0084001 [Helianthus annuus]
MQAKTTGFDGMRFIEEGARNALSLAGTMLGYYPVRVLPSKTAIAPVNPTFLPRKKVADHQQVKPSSHATNYSNGQPYAHLSNSIDSDDTDSISYDDIGGESWQLLEENVQAIKQISANFSSLKVHENIDLFSKIAVNIGVLLKE